MSFEPDDKIQQIAEAYALDAVDLARQTFRVRLDWSDSSIRELEAILDHFHQDLPSVQPSEEQIGAFAKMFGSYIGEVFRKNHGARWGTVTLAGEGFPGMQANHGGGEFWPWGRVQNRLLNGAEDNVWHYYQFLVSKAGSDDLAQGSLPSTPRPWWRRIFRGA